MAQQGILHLWNFFSYRPFHLCGLTTPLPIQWHNNTILDLQYTVTPELCYKYMCMRCAFRLRLIRAYPSRAIMNVVHVCVVILLQYMQGNEIAQVNNI